MAARDDEQIVEQLADLLAGYDQALRDGTPLPAESAATTAEVPARLGRAQACLRRLHSKWRGHSYPPPMVDRNVGVSSSGDFAPSFDPCTAGMRLGRFEIIRLLGRGGHGIVYLARDPALRRTVALKVARPDTILDPDLHARLRREAEAAAGLDHPNLVPVYELGQSGPWVYIVSAYCPGPSLAAWLKSRKDPVPVATAADLVAALADAVAYMHSRGILHRDIKPGNVLLVSGEWVSGEWSDGPRADLSSVITHHSPLTPKLTDFGLAKLTDSGVQETQTGAILGTPAYMSPEQAAGQTRELGPVCDVYALGVLLFEILTGRPPFEGETTPDVLRKVISDEPLSPRRLRRAVPRDLATICLHCLLKEPQKRYAGARELADDLRRFLHGEPIQARPVSAWTKTARWTRRHVRLLTCVALGILAFVGTLHLLQWRATLEAQEGMWQQRIKQHQELHRARLRYAGQMSLAEQMWVQGDFITLGSILSDLRQDPAQAERLGFEWHYLWQQYRDDDFRFKIHHDDTHVTYAPDGKTLATAGKEGNVCLWDPATGQQRTTWPAHPHGVRAITFDREGRRLATCGNDHAVRLWDPGTGRLLATCIGHHDCVTCVAFSPDGGTLASGSDDHTLILWNAATGQPSARCTAHTDSVHAVVFTADGKRVVSGSPAGTMRLWDSRTGALLRTESVSAIRLAISPDGRWLATGGQDGIARLWDTESWLARAIIPPPSNGVDWLAFSPDGKRLAKAAKINAGQTFLVSLWELADLTGDRAAKARPSATIHLPEVIDSLAFAPNDRTLAVASGQGSVRLWHPDYPASPLRPALRHSPEEAWCVAFAPDGKTSVSGGDNGRGHAPLKLSDPVTGKTLWSSRGHEALVSCVAFSPDGKWIASGGYDNTVQLSEPATGKVSVTLRRHTAALRCLAFSPDGTLLASAGRDRNVILWDLRTGTWLRTLTGHRDEIRGVAFLDNGRQLVSAALDNMVHTWDVTTGKNVSTFEDTSGIDSLTVSPDGTLLAWGKEDGRIELLDLSTGQRRLLSGTHQGHVRALAFSPDGRTLATAGKDRLIRLWDPATGFNLLTLRGHLLELHALAFSPRGDVLASASHDGAVRLWWAGSGR
jgi:WD40 repeat protein